MNKLKRLTYLFLILTFLLFDAPCVIGADNLQKGQNNPAVTQTSAMPFLDATAVLAMEAGSGRVLYSKNPTVRKSIASTTKIMTAIVALENGSLDDEVTISAKAAAIGGSTIDLRKGQKFTLQELLYGMLLSSGNDAAVAVAEHIGGSTQGFAEMMNKKARELGAENTSYVTPHGLDAQGQYSTAYDLAIITRYALENPVFARIVSTSSAFVAGRQLSNTNELLRLYPGVDGVKTGYTGQAGRCLVTSAIRDGMRIISVVLGSPTSSKRADASRKLLDYCFNNYSMYRLIEAGSAYGKIPVHKGFENSVSVRAMETIQIPLREDELDRLETRAFLPQTLEAPVYGGTETGYVEFLVDDTVVGHTMLSTWKNVRRKGFIDYLGDFIGEWCRLMYRNPA